MIAAANSLVAFKAWKIVPAAIKSDGNAVDFGMVMGTAGFGIDVQSFNIHGMGHGKPPEFNDLN